MNESTRKQLEVTTPSAARPVDKLRLTEAPAAMASGSGPHPSYGVCGCGCICCATFSDDDE